MKIGERGKYATQYERNLLVFKLVKHKQRIRLKCVAIILCAAVIYLILIVSSLDFLTLRHLGGG